MELYIGGISQGKLSYVCNNKMISKDSEDICDGSCCSMEDIFSKKIINHFHIFIKRVLTEWAGDNQEFPVDISWYPDQMPGDFAQPQKLMEVFIEKLIANNKEAILICNEVGYGIVPMNKADRMYREIVGRSSCRLAEYSCVVERVVCGLGMKLK